MTACDDDDDVYGVLDGLEMINRTQSVVDNSTIRSNSTNQIVLQYNNLVGIDASKSITVNGQSVAARVNPDNGMELIIPITLKSNTDYVVEIPEGAVYRKDDISVVAEQKTITFNTNVGINKNLIATSLTNANASTPAKNVYKFMLENYGSKQLSGAMGEVAWGTTFTDLVASAAGAYPAIIGFDYIHLASSAAGSWIDYSDITPVSDAWNSGSLPAFSWHWLVPGAETKAVAELSNERLDVGGWANVLQISADKFADAKVGQSILVTFSDLGDNPQGSLKNSSWAAIASDTEYFSISGSSYSHEIDSDILASLQSGGLIVGGQNYVITGVYLAEGDSELKYTAGRSFSPKNILTDGTWENSIYKADVAKVAGYLALLRDAGIPVLWRPFHEAAGEYKSDVDGVAQNGAWFWWGQDGVDVTKQLWQKLYNDLTNTYGLNNLIWVWTVQTTKDGNLASLSDTQSSYPGDSYVDIVCADLYKELGDNDGQVVQPSQTEEFDLVNATAGRKKIVALGECGNLLNVNAAANDDALWSYFMSWYDMADDGTFGFNTWNSADIWRTVLSNPLVINRGGLNVK